MYWNRVYSREIMASSQLRRRKNCLGQTPCCVLGFQLQALACYTPAFLYFQRQLKPLSSFTHLENRPEPQHMNYSNYYCKIKIQNNKKYPITVNGFLKQKNNDGMVSILFLSFKFFNGQIYYQSHEMIQINGEGRNFI